MTPLEHPEVQKALTVLAAALEASEDGTDNMTMGFGLETQSGKETMYELTMRKVSQSEAEAMMKHPSNKLAEPGMTFDLKTGKKLEEKKEWEL